MNKKSRRFANLKKAIRSHDRFRPQFESLEQRVLFANDPFGGLTAPGFTTGVFGTWTPIGPFSATEGQVENIANKLVVGAIHAVLAHPTNPNTLYVGSINGGVWKSTDATSSQPRWSSGSTCSVA